MVPGNGLLGMRERIHELGGTVTFGAERGAGFGVIVRLPREPAPSLAAAGAPDA